MKLYLKFFILGALLYVKFFQNFLIKMLEDIEKIAALTL